MIRPLSEAVQSKVQNILREVAEQTGTTPEVLLALQPKMEFVNKRKQLYHRLHDELKLTYAAIGRICNRSPDAVADLINLTNRGKNGQPPAHLNGGYTKQVTTWLSRQDHSLLCKLAKKHNVTAEDMARGAIVDAIAEEFPTQG